MELIKPNEISSKVLTLIEESDQFVYLVSPYVNILKWYKLLNKINNLKKRKVHFKFIIRKDENNKRSFDDLNELGVPYTSIPNLHAKLYINEKEAIITSLNLLLNSEINSLEIGYRTQTKEEYQEIIDFCERYLQINFEEFSVDNQIGNNVSPSPVSSENSIADARFVEKHNFFLPQLYESIKNNRTLSNITLKNEGKLVANFSDTIELEEQLVTNVYFKDKIEYSRFKGLHQREINQKLSSYRVYWNDRKINIYPSKGYEVEISESGMQDILEHKLFIINTLKSYLGKSN